MQGAKSTGEPAVEKEESFSNDVQNQQVARRSGRNEGGSLASVWRVVRALTRHGALATEGAAKRISGWLNRLETGRAQDLRTPFFAEKGVGGKLRPAPRSRIVSGLRERMAQVRVEPGLGKVLITWENDEAEDIGPWSTYLPAHVDLPAKVKAVYSDKQLSVDVKALDRSLDWLTSLVQEGSVEQVSVEDAINGERSGTANDEEESGLDTSTNSGMPFVIRRWKPTDAMDPETRAQTDEAFRWYVDMSKTLIRELSAGGEMPHQYAIASQRLVQKGPKPYASKSKRLVAAFPKYEAIVAKTLTFGMVEKMRAIMLDGIRVMIGWTNLPNIDVEMQKLLQAAANQKQIILSGDVSNFDASVPPELLWRVAQAMAVWLRGNGAKIFRAMAYGMIYNTSLITPDKIYPAGPSSLKSGSGYTQILGSGANLTILRYGHEIGLYKMQNVCVLSDDSILRGDGCTPDSISATYKAFGMESHPEKQFYEENSLHYLQRLHYLGRPGGVASVMRTLGHVLGFENMRYRPGEEFNSYSYVIRALSQLKNCEFSPYLVPFVEFMKEGDKLGLGADLSPSEILDRSGIAGRDMMRLATQAPWRKLGPNTQFENWLVNGVLREEKPPPAGDALFERVHGIKVGEVSRQL